MVFTPTWFCLCWIAGARQLVSVAVDSGGQMETLRHGATKSETSLHHTLHAGTMHFAVRHNGKSILFNDMEEYHLFGEEGFDLLGDAGTITYMKPTFRTFKAKQGPYARVHLSNKGDLTGWTRLDGKLLRLNQLQGQEHATLTLVGLEHTALEQSQVDVRPKMKRNNRSGDKNRKDAKKDGGKDSQKDKQDEGEIDESVEAEHEHDLESMADDVIDYVDGKDCKDPVTGIMDFCHITVDKHNADGSEGLHAPGELHPEELLQLDVHAKQTPWGGVKWYGGGQCYPDDDKPRVMKLGVVVDRAAMRDPAEWNTRRNFQYQGGTWLSEIAHQFDEANAIYQNQMNIELQIGFELAASSESAAPRFMQQNGGWCSPTGIQQQLSGQADFFRNQARSDGWASFGDKYNYDNVASVQMFSGCNPSGYGTVGLAFVGTLCNKGRGGVNHINSGARTFAHELGHNFNGRHSFEDGQGKTGGIMDYGNGQDLLTPIQFNTKYRKVAVCAEVREATRQCSSNAFYIAAENDGSPRRRAPVTSTAPPRRRRAPVTTAPRRRRAPATTPPRRRRAPATTAPRRRRAPATTAPRRRRAPATTAPRRRRSPATTAPRRRRAPATTPTPEVRCCDTDSSICDRPETGIRFSSGAMVSCPQLFRHCSGLKFVREACPATCNQCPVGATTTTAQISTTSTIEGGCITAGSVSSCNQCRDDSQCQSGSYCCPSMKLCTKAGNLCQGPWARCSGSTCNPSDGTAYADWGGESCPANPCCEGGSPCDEEPTKIRNRGRVSTCSELKSKYCHYAFVKKACPSSCGECGNSLLLQESSNQTLAEVEDFLWDEPR